MNPLDSITIDSLQVGDIISIEVGGVTIHGLTVRVSSLGSRYAILPGNPHVVYLDRIYGARVTSRVRPVPPLPTKQGWYQSTTGRSMYLLSVENKWFELSRYGKLFPKSDSWDPKEELRPFTPVGTF